MSKFVEDDFKGKEEFARIKAKRQEIMAANNSCANCTLGIKTLAKVKCNLKSKLVNSYNFCESWKEKVKVS